MIDILVQRYRNARAAKRFFRKLLKGQGSAPWKLVTDKLQSYGVAHGVILNFFSFSRHRMRSENYRWLRARSFKEWSMATAA